MGVKALVVACAWIAMGLTVAERALGAPQSQNTREAGRRRNSTTQGQSAQQRRGATARQNPRKIPVRSTRSPWELRTCASRI